MWFEIINATCWIITFICFYLILNPNIKIIKNVYSSPFKKAINTPEKKFNVIKSLQLYSQDKLIKLSKSFHNNFDIIVFNFNGSLNVGNIMRIGCLYGVRNFFIIGRKIYDSRSCVGSNKFVNLNFIKDIVTKLPEKNCKPEIDKVKFKNLLIKYNLIPIFIEQGGRDISNYKFQESYSNSKTPVFIFGNETHGIDSDVINYCSDMENFTILSIPQLGVLRSLNVSNSASIILWEFYKQNLIKNDIRFKLNL